MKTVLMIIVLALAAFAGYAAMQPADFSVTRTATMSASAATIFPHVNNLHQWEAWSPWAKMDPNATMSYNGPTEGQGAGMSWAGNMQVGAGTMTITESTAPSNVKFALDFTKPMKGTNTAEFTFTPAADPTQTTVTWTMTGHKNFIAKAMGVIMNCEKMVSEQFDKGLANLKTIVESEATAAPVPAVTAAPAEATSSMPED